MIAPLKSLHTPIRLTGAAAALSETTPLATLSQAPDAMAASITIGHGLANVHRQFASAEGQFVAATPEQIARVGERYLAGVRGERAAALVGEVSRVGTENLAVDLNSATPARLAALREGGTKLLSSFYHFTSGAGLWSRGGGQVKALVPFNLIELIPHRVERLSALSDLVNAKSPADVLLITKTDVPKGMTIEEVAAPLVAAAKREIDEILTEARENPLAMTPVGMKLVHAAIMSRNAGTFVPFDVWTSAQTHKPIVDYITRFKNTYREVTFHPDPVVQAQVVSSLTDYFAHGSSHVFGYQEGLPALRPDTGAPIAGTPLIGEGAGRAKAYLDHTGRTAELEAMGKRIFSFENIEVLTDWTTVLGAYSEAGKAVAVVLVPQKKGYAGGNPFMVDLKNLVLLEQSALPAELANGNTYFNSNTIVQPLSASASSSLGFEVKNNNTQVRAKNNAGDITHELPTAGIGGRIGVEYENFKTYPDYVRNGSTLIDTYRALWARDLMRVPSPVPGARTVDWDVRP